ncbi:cyanate hydratase [Gautieria morchelliformis]|nr:cyanate hydratase [Gautieria morchelliformis]
MSAQPQLAAPFQTLLDAKAKKGVTFEQIAKAVGKDEVWVAALMYGQAKATPEQLTALTSFLGIQQASVTADLGANWFPDRGVGPIPPTDPVIYRLYEAVLVYGHPLKAVIHEKFGDGIMSMIDCTVRVERKPHPKGDRVLLTFDGKFLPYATW